MMSNVIPAFLQKRGLNFSEFSTVFKDLLAGKSASMVTESAKFDAERPAELQVSDDTWASLTLRVDPLAKAVLDPHNLYLGALILTTLMSSVFLAVKPGPIDTSGFDDDYVRDDDFNDKYNDVDDYWKYHDVETNQYSYESREAARARVLWTVLFALTISSLVGVTAIVAYMLESRNARIDVFIYEICDEMAERFEQEGYDIEYKTRIVDEGLVGHFMPERAICFVELADSEIGKRTNQNSGYSPPEDNMGMNASLSDDSAPVKPKRKNKKESSFGSINVMVPDGYKPGQVVNVMTPSGLPIMVAVPSGLSPGESFPVKIPAQMYRPRK